MYDKFIELTRIRVLFSYVLRREHDAGKDYIGLQRVQTEELQYFQEQEERSRSLGVQQVLPFLQKAHTTQRN